MSLTFDRERAEIAFDGRIERAKQLLRELQAVLVAHVDGETVSSAARRLGMSRHRLRWMQRVLGLREGKTRTGWRTVRLRHSHSIGMEVR